jgi:predicted lysophospholipase L1 biosynthesis ABC-type transport system permease subunit
VYVTSYTHLIVLIVALLFTIAAIWAVLITINDTHYRVADKVVWTIALICIPVVGLVLWSTTRVLKRSRVEHGPSV